MKLILASQSPRRAQILREHGFSPIVIPAHTPEVVGIGESASDYVLRLSLEKANAVLAKTKDVRRETDDDEIVVLAADTTVVLGDKILEKPADANEAFMMLNALSGTTHHVLTGYTLLCITDLQNSQTAKQISGCVQTSVTFHTLSEKQIQDYVDSGDPFDKAGSYGIQSVRDTFVKAINGSYYNVMGLPIEEILVQLKNLATNPLF